MRFRAAFTLALLGIVLPGRTPVSADTWEFDHFLLTDEREFSVVFAEGWGTMTESEIVSEVSTDDPDRVLKRPGTRKLVNITLRRPLSADSSLAEWGREVERYREGEEPRRDLSLVAFDADMEPIGRWRLQSAWPAGLVVSVSEERAWEKVIIVFDELEPVGDDPPELPVIVIRLPSEGQTIHEPPVRIVAEVSSPESEVEVLRVHGGDELLQELAGPRARHELEWSVSGGGTKTLSVSVVDNHGRTVIAERKFTYSPSKEIEYTSWRDAWFLPEEMRDPGDNPDGDRYTNLAEFAFRGNPLRPGTARAPGWGSASEREGWAEFSYVRRTGGTGTAVDFTRPDIRYILEETTDLSAGWEPSPVPDGIARSATVTPDPDGLSETVTIHFDEPPAGVFFVRLRIALRE